MFRDGCHEKRIVRVFVPLYVLSKFVFYLIERNRNYLIVCLYKMNEKTIY